MVNDLLSGQNTSQDTLLVSLPNATLPEPDDERFSEARTAERSRCPVVILDNTELEFLAAEEQIKLLSSPNNSNRRTEGHQISAAGTSAVITLAAQRPTPSLEGSLVPLGEAKKKRYLFHWVRLMDGDVTIS